MDHRVLRFADRFPAGVDIADGGAGKTRYRDAFGLARDLFDGGKIAGGGSGKARFNNVHIKTNKALSHLELLFGSHSRSGRLFTITQSGVKNSNNRRVCHDFFSSLRYEGIPRGIPTSWFQQFRDVYQRV